MLYRSVRASCLERTRPLPGDQFIPEPIASLTHAITIRNRTNVWPWSHKWAPGVERDGTPTMSSTTEGIRARFEAETGRRKTRAAARRAASTVCRLLPERHPDVPRQSTHVGGL